MAVILRKEWFGGIVGDTHSYNLKTVNKYTYEWILKNKLRSNSINKLISGNGINMHGQNLNIIDKLDDFHIKNKILTAPIIAWLELTNKCTNKCKHCFKKDLSENEITSEILIKRLNEFKDLGVYKITLTGGEPLLYNGLENLLETINQLDLGLRIFTSASVNSDYLYRLKNYNIDILFVSLDGYFESNDILRGKESYMKIINNIEILNSKFDKIKDIVISLTLHKSNLKDLEDIYLLCKKYNIKTILIRPLMIYSWFEKDTKLLALNKADLFSVLNKLYCLSKKYSIEYQINKIPISPIKKGYFYHDKKYNISINSLFDTHSIDCVGGQLVCGMKKDGNIIPCGFIDLPYSNTSNINSQDFVDVWKYSSNINMMRNISNTNRCSTCQALILCGGGCRSNGYENSRALNEIDENCLFFQTKAGGVEYSPEHFYPMLKKGINFLNKEKEKFKKNKIYISKFNLVSKCGWCGGEI